MSRYETDEEQWEAIKQWWKENGTQAIVAVLVAVLAVAGWRYYQSMQYAQAVNASSTFDILRIQYQAGKFKDVAREAHRLMSERPESPYAAGAAFMLASWQYEEEKKPDEALETLKWIVEHAPSVGLRMTAQVRGARLLADQRKYDQAEKWLMPVEKDALSPETRSMHDYVQGEIALFRQDKAAARQAFERVADNPQAHEGLIQLARLQLMDLAEE